MAPGKMIRVNDSLNFSGKPKRLSAVEHYHRRLSFASRVFSLSRGKFFVLFDCKSLVKEGLTTLHENNRCFTFSGIRCKRKSLGLRKHCETGHPTSVTTLLSSKVAGTQTRGRQRSQSLTLNDVEAIQLSKGWEIENNVECDNRRCGA